MHARYVNSAYLRIWTFIWMHPCMYVYTYVYIANVCMLNMCVYECLCKHMLLHTHTHIYLYIHTYVHVYMIYIYTTRARLYSGWAAYIVLCLKPAITYAIFDKVIQA